LTKGHVLGALSEGEQPCVPRSPTLELLHRAREQRLRDAPLVQIRPHGDRPEEAEAPPIRRKIGADELSVDGCGEGCDVRRTLAAIHHVAVGPERVRVGRAEKRCKGVPEDTLRVRQVLGPQRTDDRRRVRHGTNSLHAISPP
jgi:hypothetical protein